MKIVLTGLLMAASLVAAPAIAAERARVRADRAAIAERLRVYPAFAGVSIHAWSGWQALPDQ